jgi:hypothetical protein
MKLFKGLQMILEKTNTFATDVESLILERKMDYIDAVVYWCEQHNIEVDYAAQLVKNNAVLLSKIKSEAENLNILKRTAQLPI